MGEYYIWANVDKREYLEPFDFDYGGRSTETILYPNSFLLALKSLMANEWKGDHLVWLGDEAIFMDAYKDNPALKLLYKQAELSDECDFIYEKVSDQYKNVSGLFKDVDKGFVREEITYYIEDVRSGKLNIYNEYGIDINDPFKGLFNREGEDFTFVINHTKKLYYSLEKTIMIMDRINSKDNPFDPLPILMMYGRNGAGKWFGDIIDVSNEAIKGYRFLRKIDISD